MTIKGKVSRSDMRKAERLVLKHQETLLKIWEELHG
jgi:hypothetical protein